MIELTMSFVTFRKICGAVLSGKLASISVLSCALVFWACAGAISAHSSAIAARIRREVIWDFPGILELDHRAQQRGRLDVPESRCRAARRLPRCLLLLQQLTVAGLPPAVVSKLPRGARGFCFGRGEQMAKAVERHSVPSSMVRRLWSLSCRGRAPGRRKAGTHGVLSHPAQQNHPRPSRHVAITAQPPRTSDYPQDVHTLKWNPTFGWSDPRASVKT
jgi:hypothetical protein